MDLQEKLISLSKYNIGFKTYNDKFLVSITYKPEWSVIKPMDNDVQFMRDNDKKDSYYYIAPLDEKAEHLQGIFNTIDETITYNEELEKKVELLQKKIEEMQQLFTDKPLEELLTMEFTFKGEKKKKKQTKKKETTVEEHTQEEPKKEDTKEEEENDIDKRVSEIMKKKNKKTTA